MTAVISTRPFLWLWIRAAHGRDDFRPFLDYRAALALKYVYPLWGWYLLATVGGNILFFCSLHSWTCSTVLGHTHPTSTQLPLSFCWCTFSPCLFNILHTGDSRTNTCTLGFYLCFYFYLHYMLLSCLHPPWFWQLYVLMWCLMQTQKQVQLLQEGFELQLFLLCITYCIGTDCFLILDSSKLQLPLYKKSHSDIAAHTYVLRGGLHVGAMIALPRLLLKCHWLQNPMALLPSTVWWRRRFDVLMCWWKNHQWARERKEKNNQFHEALLIELKTELGTM